MAVVSSLVRLCLLELFSFCSVDLGLTLNIREGKSLGGRLANCGATITSPKEKHVPSGNRSHVYPVTSAVTTTLLSGRLRWQRGHLTKYAGRREFEIPPLPNMLFFLCEVCERCTSKVTLHTLLWKIHLFLLRLSWLQNTSSQENSHVGAKICVKSW